ncbi:putative transcription activator [Sanguibacter keddieii DSM 10542]|uniref:Transcription activator n=1 Tax=Sanguibacter keddieii (strain ATCC 51767 / DSM 10542 / NCFB 3025 / ST-74) TaxID=446469 RepID=D1BDE6_SANKS|nr:GyrI-like domain-containing protein [Sanguibacter keddieii]ACZ21008.1 putative transcription activator [Sanguibacter keddieii DSM 10542]
MSITLDRTVVPAMTVVALRGTVPTYADEVQLWERMMPLLEAQAITPSGPGGVIEHDDEYTPHDVELSIFVPVAPGTLAVPPLEVLELPSRDCLVARVLGSYDQITEAHRRIDERVAAEHLTFATGEAVERKAFNLYLRTPDQVGEQDLVTEVCEPLA